MASILVALRDLMIGLALAWVGITMEHPPQRAAEPSVAPACETASAACNAERVLERVKQ